MKRHNDIISGRSLPRSIRILPVLTLTITLILAAACTSLAESSEYTGECRFDGKKIQSTFSEKTVAKAVEDLQPGDDVTFKVKFINMDKEDTDWYMENLIFQTLEKTKAKKKVSGTGTAENGGYTYELTHVDKNGKSDVLYSNERVGGENKVQDIDNPSKELEGLEPATNALDEWFYIETLGYNESGTIKLRVAFDGETEVNDYMDTDGELRLRFAVEKNTEKTPPPEPDVPPHIKTGDESRLIMWSVIGLTGGMLMIVLLWLSRRSDKKAEERR